MLENLHDRNVKLGKAALNFSDIDLFELPVPYICLLISYACTSTSDSRWGKRCSKDEARSIRPNHVDKVHRACDITSDGAISLTKSTYNIPSAYLENLVRLHPPVMMSTRSITEPGIALGFSPAVMCAS